METSPDEDFLAYLAVFSTAATLWCLESWLSQGPTLGRRGPARFVALASLPLGWLWIFLALSTGSAQDVQNSPQYFMTMLGLGVGWLTLLTLVLPWLGLSLVDDILQRHNTAAALVFAGAVTGASLIYAGSNIGEGPTLWTSLFPAALGTVSWLGSWALFEAVGQSSRSVAESRDVASGLRLAGLLLALGLMHGRAMAGRWISVSDTIGDLGHWWVPMLLLWTLAAVLERRLRPQRTCPFPAWTSHGLAPAVLYLIFALIPVLTSGSWRSLIE